MRVVGAVLDTAALVAYARGSDRVGDLVVTLAERGELVLIPAVCLACAYRDVDDDGRGLLDLLVGLAHCEVLPMDRDHCIVVGDWARMLGLDTAHAAVEAATHAVVPLVTSRRDLVRRFLPEGWPILDVST